MSSTRGSGGGPDECDTGSWTTETLPLSVRKELLERELRNLGFRKKGEPGGAASAQQHPHSGGDGHPQAGGSEGAHGD